MKTALFLDRDGVLTKLVKRDNGFTAPWHRDELEFLPDIKTAIDIAKTMFDYAFVISNQPDVNDGFMNDSFLSFIDSHLKLVFGINDVYNAKERGKWDYKPNPGMIKSFEKLYNLDLNKCYMIGDSWKDCVCANLSFVRYVHIGDNDPIGRIHWNAYNLLDAVRIIKRKFP